MKKDFKILIIGLGSIGSRHLRNLIALGYKNIIGVDTNILKLNSAEKEFGIKVYNNPELALKTENVDITMICTSTNQHVPLAKLAVNFKSHLFIEKPVSNKLSGLESLIKEAGENKIIAMVACNYRFHKTYEILLAALKSKKYGEVLRVNVVAGYFLPTARPNSDYRKIYASTADEGGVILDSAIHVIDYLKPLAGPMTRCFFLKSRLHPLGIKSEEIAGLLLEHKSGVISSVTLDFISLKPVHRIELVTKRGLFSLDLREGMLTFSNDKTTELLSDRSHVDEISNMFVSELEHFLQCVEKQRKPLQDLNDAKNSLEIILSAKNL